MSGSASAHSGPPGAEDFPDTETGRSLSALDSSLRCGICYGIYDTPLVLRACSHAFCSSCIRANLDFQERAGQPVCPSCRRPCDARDLLPCHALREASTKFFEARALIVELFKELATARQEATAPADNEIVIMVDERPCTTDNSSKKLMVSPDPSGPLTRSRTGIGSSSHRPSVREEQASSSEEWSSGSEEVVSSQEPSPAKTKRPRIAARQRTKKKDQSIVDMTVSTDVAITVKQDLESSLPENTLLPRGFVDCPVCGKSVPSFYINSHVDACLNSGGSRAHEQEAAAPSSSDVEAPCTSFEPLALPPKLVPNLMSDKALRQLLKRFCLPVEGRRAEMIARYTRLRREVQVANDRGEQTTYARLSRRVLGAERQVAAATLLGGGASGDGAQPAGCSFDRRADHVMDNAPSIEVSEPVSEGFLGDSWRELVEATRRRDAARRAQKAVAAIDHDLQRKNGTAEMRIDGSSDTITPDPIGCNAAGGVNV